MIELPRPAATAALGNRLATALQAFDHGLVVALTGELGAGKTALTRAVLQFLGHAGAVVSPSYTLVEPYPVAGRVLYHMDLYRLADPEELEFLGVREIDAARDWLFIEWPERGAGFLPVTDIAIALDYADSGRTAQITTVTAQGSAFFSIFQNAR